VNKKSFSKPEGSDFSNENAFYSFAENIHSDQDLIQKELALGRAREMLLAQRIETAKSLMNDTSTNDPQYLTLFTQIQMDQIELIELKFREEDLKKHLSKALINKTVNKGMVWLNEKQNPK